MDKSKVVHIRIPSDIIIGCYDTLELVAGRTTDNLSVAQVVGDALKGFVRGAMKKALIPEYTLPDLQARYDTIFKDDDEQTFEAGFIDDREEEESASPPREQFMAQIEEHMNQLTAKAASVPEGIVEQPNPQAPKKARPKWDSDEARNFERLAKIQPLDRFIQQAKEEKDDALKICISLIYSSLDESLWGSAMAEKSIQQLYDMYLEDMT